MGLTLWNFDAYKKGSITRDEAITLIKKTPTETDVLKKQLNHLRELYKWFKAEVKLWKNWSRSELHFRSTLLSKIDTMSMEPNMTGDMLDEIQSMAEFITWNETKIDGFIEWINARRRTQKILEMEDNY